MSRGGINDKKHNNRSQFFSKKKLKNLIGSSDGVIPKMQKRRKKSDHAEGTGIIPEDSKKRKASCNYLLIFIIQGVVQS